MFKFAKYFFIVFLITAILPLALMFAWNNTQMNKFHIAMLKYGLNNASTKLEHAIRNNLKVQEGDVLKKLYFNGGIKSDSHSVKDVLKDYSVEFSAYSQNNPEILSSYYEQKNAELYSVTVLPYEGIKQNLKISKKVDINQLRPPGPYNIEITYGTDENPVMHRYYMDPVPVPKNDRFLRIADKVFRLTPGISAQKVLKITGVNNEEAARITISFSNKPSKGKLDNILTGLTILLVGIISSFVIGIIINKVFVLPVMALSKGARQIKRGNFSFRLDSDSKIELVRNLYNSFNDMAQNLETKEKLRESFISNLTHDLRTPLVSQEQSLRFISDKFKEIGLQNEYELAESLAKNNEHLLKMVNLILESYSFDSAKLTLNKESVDLYDTVEDCAEKLRPLFNEKKIEFVNDIYKGGTTIPADRFQLSRVFINLLSNAVENANEGNYVKVNASYKGNAVYIDIEDNGNGIAHEDIEVIFERYYSGKSLERKLGAGFGLSVCRHIIEMHGGEISVESELNKFTRFTIKLPLI